MQSYYKGRQPPPITITLLIIQIIAWMLASYLLPFGAGCNSCTSAGEWWRLFTSLFLHTDFSHVFSNCISLLLLGTYLEARIGQLKFCMMFVLTGIAGNIMTYFLMPPSFIHVGSSGAIFGLVGLQIYFFYLQKYYYDKRELSTFTLLLLFMVSLTFLDDSVNVAAHLGGLLAGGLLAPFLIKEQSKLYRI